MLAAPMLTLMSLLGLVSAVPFPTRRQAGGQCPSFALQDYVRVNS